MGTGAGVRSEGGSCKHKEPGEGGEGVTQDGGLGMSYPQACELEEKVDPFRDGGNGEGGQKNMETEKPRCNRRMDTEGQHLSCVSDVNGLEERRTCR